MDDTKPDHVLTKDCYEKLERVTPETLDCEILYYDGEYAVIYENGILHDYILKNHPELVDKVKVPSVIIQEFRKSIQSIKSAYINIEEFASMSSEE